MMDAKELFSAVFTLALVMDPAGNIPLFISALRNVPEKKRARVIVRELFIALGIMLFFLFFGKYLISALNIELLSLNVAGGIILFIIALGMIFPGNKSIAENPEGEPFIVPLAVPLVCGPSTMTMILLFAMKKSEFMFSWFAVVVLAWLVNIVILGFSGKIAGFFGKRGMQAVEKLMGMILVVLSVQMFLDGISRFIGK